MIGMIGLFLLKYGKALFAVSLVAFIVALAMLAIGFLLLNL